MPATEEKLARRSQWVLPESSGDGKVRVFFGKRGGEGTREAKKGQGLPKEGSCVRLGAGEQLECSEGASWTCVC